MSTTKIDYDQPAYLDVEIPSTATKVLNFKKPDTAVFNAQMKAVVTSSENSKSIKIKTYTAGQGITINGNDLQIEVKGEDYKRYAGSTIYITVDHYNAGFRDLIIRLKLKYSPL